MEAVGFDDELREADLVITGREPSMSSRFAGRCRPV